MTDLIPIRCSCHKVIGRENVILEFIGRANEVGNIIKEEKEEKLRELAKEKLTFSERRKRLQEIANKTKSDMVEEVDIIFTELGFSRDKYCCRMYIADAARKGITTYFDRVVYVDLPNGKEEERRIPGSSTIRYNEQDFIYVK